VVNEKYNMEHKYEKERLKKDYVKRLRSLLNTDITAQNKM